MDVTEAFYNAKRALETTKVCVFEQPSYGFPKCRTHQGGTRYDGATQTVCDKATAEGRLRKALADLMLYLTVKIEVRP